jgi:hypothetical protein
MKARKVIQIATMPEGETAYPALLALCSDGALFLRVFENGNEAWEELPPVPQPASCTRREIFRDVLTRKSILREYMSDNTFIDTDISGFGITEVG